MVSEVHYDNNDRPWRKIAADGSEIRTVFTPIGQVERTISAFGTPLQRVTQFEYNDLGLQIKAIQPDGGYTTTEYDEAGRVLVSYDRVGRGTYNSYDSLGRPVRKYRVRPGAGSATSRFIANASGEPIYSEMRYDDLNRVYAARDTHGRWSYTRYEDAGNAVESEDASGRVTKILYDELNRAYKVTDAKLRTTAAVPLGVPEGTRGF